VLCPYAALAGGLLHEDSWGMLAEAVERVAIIDEGRGASTAIPAQAMITGAQAWDSTNTFSKSLSTLPALAS